MVGWCMSGALFGNKQMWCIPLGDDILIYS